MTVLMNPINLNYKYKISCTIYYINKFNCSFSLPSFASFVPSFLHSFLRSFLPSFILPSFLLSFHFSKKSDRKNLKRRFQEDDRLGSGSGGQVQHPERNKSPSHGINIATQAVKAINVLTE